MLAIFITANFKFRNCSSWSKGPINRAGKVCGDFQDLKSPGRCATCTVCSLSDMSVRNITHKVYLSKY